MIKKILLVSLGSIGKRHLRNTRDLLPDCEIAVYRQHNKNATSIPEGVDHLFFTIEEALVFEADAVIISSPASDHIENAKRFLENGANIFIEKPLSVDNRGLDHFVGQCEESEKFIMVGYVLRFQPIINFIKNYLDNENIGKIRTARVEVGQYLPDWRPDGNYRDGVSAQKKLGGGVLLELSHEIDYAMWIFGYPDALYCSLAKVSNLDIDVEDTATLIMDYNKENDKKRVTVHLDFLQRKAVMAIKIVGENGTLYADLIDESMFIVLADGSTKLIDVPKVDGANEMYLRQFDLFFKKSFSDYKVKYSDTKNHNHWATVKESAKVMEIVDLARESDLKGIRVNL